MSGYDRRMEALLGYVGAEVSLQPCFGRWLRYASWALDNENAAVGRAQARNLLMAAGGEIGRGSPLWQYCWKLSEMLDTGVNVLRDEVKSLIGAASAQVGRGALWDWMWHTYLFSEG